MIHFIEELSINAWPSIHTYHYDGWLLRYANGYSKRANSILPLYDETYQLPQKVSFCREFYSSRNLPTIFKLTSNLKHQKIDQYLCAKQYLKLDETRVMLNDISNKSCVNNNNILVQNSLSSQWIDNYISCAKINSYNVFNTLQAMLSKVVGETIWLTYIHNRIAVGCVYGVIDRGYLGVYNVYVSKQFRGQGFGEAIVTQLFHEAQKRNIHKTYLQVLLKNEVANNLYNKLGYTEVYKYWYRRSFFE